ncbi:MerC domain-containing protein [Aquimarina longa]|uniref:MerC domain-containing protein n=1 Tax=Aquimarina longa TaxID=1080221 RepID=UPI00078578B5|nr:MerC domain-containing protein [Aquimarina longa]
MIEKTIQVNWDFIGFFASFLCLIHCLFLPICIAIFPIMGFVLITDVLYEILLVISSLIIAFIAIYRGYKKYHKKLSPIFIYLEALIFFGAGFIAADYFVGKIFHFLATCFLIIAHYYNWKYTKKYKNCRIIYFK